MANQIKSKALSNIEVSSFCNQMAMILQSGISSIEGISIMLEDAQSNAEKEILQEIYTELQTSGSFYEALKASLVFPSYLLHMVNIGEQTGKLDEVMNSLSQHYDREDSIAKTIKNAVTYPLIMIVMMLFVILILIMKVMPIFNQVFNQLGREMTGFSKGILTFGTTLGRYSTIFVGILVLFILILLYFTRTTNGRSVMMTLGYRFSFSRVIYEKIASCRFASGMSLTLSSGMNPDQCLELVGQLVGNHLFQNKIQACQTLIADGSDLSHALTESRIFSGIYSRMVSIGAKTGVLDNVMKKIAVQYEEEIDMKITNVISTLEPTLVIILSIIVGSILLSVMLPLMGIMSSM